MSLRDEVSTLYQQRVNISYRPPAIYTIAGSPNVIFTIAGGPIWVKAIFARCVQAIAAGTTFATTLCAIAMENAAVAVAGLINTIITIPLGAGAGQVMIPALLAQPPYSLANALLGQVGQGQIASVGTFELTVAVADADGTTEWFMVWQRMHPASSVV